MPIGKSKGNKHKPLSHYLYLFDLLCYIRQRCLNSSYARIPEVIIHDSVPLVVGNSNIDENT